MTRLSLLSLIALGLAACGGPEDVPAGELELESDALEQIVPASIDRSPPSPAQKFVQIITGVQVRSASVGTMVTLRGTEGASSPDPMPGRQAPGACAPGVPCEDELDRGEGELR